MADIVLQGLYIYATENGSRRFSLLAISNDLAKITQNILYEHLSITKQALRRVIVPCVGGVMCG